MNTNKANKERVYCETCGLWSCHPVRVFHKLYRFVQVGGRNNGLHAGYAYDLPHAVMNMRPSRRIVSIEWRYAYVCKQQFDLKVGHFIRVK